MSLLNLFNFTKIASLVILLSNLLVIRVDSKAVTLDPLTLSQVLDRLKINKAPDSSGIEFRNNNPSSLSNNNKRKNGESGSDSIVFLNEGDNPQNSNEKYKCENEDERYHLKTGKCYKVGRLGGPCNKNMNFYGVADGNKLLGECDCSYSSQVPLVYHPQTDSCYPVYEQSYCKEGEWLIFNSNDRPICTPNKCLNGNSDYEQMVLLNDQFCVSLWEPTKKCKKGEIVGFKGDEVHPACISTVLNDSSFSSISVPKLRCKPGSFQDIKGDCRSKIKFNLNAPAQ